MMVGSGGSVDERWFAVVAIDIGQLVVGVVGEWLGRGDGGGGQRRWRWRHR